MLGCAMLVDVERDPGAPSSKRYRFRLDGSILVAMPGTDDTRRDLDHSPRRRAGKANMLVAAVIRGDRPRTARMARWRSEQTRFTSAFRLRARMN